LITGMGAGGRVFSGGWLGEKLGAISLKTCCLGGGAAKPTVRGKRGVERAVCNLFPSLTIRGKQFRGKSRAQKIRRFKSRLLVVNTSERRQTVLDDWDRRAGRIQ
jgi:hypothetical protein